MTTMYGIWFAMWHRQLVAMYMPFVNAQSIMLGKPHTIVGVADIAGV